MISLIKVSLIANLPYKFFPHYAKNISFMIISRLSLIDLFIIKLLRTDSFNVVFDEIS